LKKNNRHLEKLYPKNNPYFGVFFQRILVCSQYGDHPPSKNLSYFVCNFSNPLQKVGNLFEIPASNGLPPSKDIDVILAFFFKSVVVLATEALS